MKEELSFTNINNQFHFVHEHEPSNVDDIPYLFLNPIFDEKKRSQVFYAQTARAFYKKGMPVVRFDYYGTGDSGGQIFEMDFNNIKNVVKELIENIIKKYVVQKVNILGLRIGADLAIKIAESYSDLINNIVLVEPVVSGKRYLIEQRSRRKMFYKINNMIDVQEKITINGNTYEDHQGYPISDENLDLLNNLDSIETNLINKNIFMFKLDTFSSRKLIGQLKEKLEKSNNVKFINYSCGDFWANLEPIKTIGLSKEIVEMCCELSEV